MLARGRTDVGGEDGDGIWCELMSTAVDTITRDNRRCSLLPGGRRCCLDWTMRLTRRFHTLRFSRVWHPAVPPKQTAGPILLACFGLSRCSCSCEILRPPKHENQIKMHLFVSVSLHKRFPLLRNGDLGKMVSRKGAMLSRSRRGLTSSTQSLTQTRKVLGFEMKRNNLVFVDPDGLTQLVWKFEVSERLRSRSRSRFVEFWVTTIFTFEANVHLQPNLTNSVRNNKCREWGNPSEEAKT